MKSAGPVSRKNGGPGGGFGFRASRSFHAGRCTAASGTVFPVGPPTFFADTPARKGARNVERVLRRSGWPWRWLRPSHTIDLQRPSFVRPSRLAVFERNCGLLFLEAGGFECFRNGNFRILRPK
jgi:hypothetical protein